MGNKIIKNNKNDFTIYYIKHLICDYMNLEPEMVSFKKQSNFEYEFKITFNSKKKLNLIVLKNLNAIYNAQALYDDINFSIQDKNIGPYRKLNNSIYFFRWLEDF